MDKSYFGKKCEELSLAIGCETPSALALNEYFKKFDNVKDSRFDEMIEVLKEGSKYKRFPLIWDFKQAQSGTVKPLNIQTEPEEEINREEYSADLLALAKKFLPPKKKGYTPKTRDQLYSEKMKSGLVWSYLKHKWIDKSLMGNIGGHFLVPEDELKKMDSDGITIKSI